MEMSRSCQHVRGPHGGWQDEEIDALKKSIEEAESSGESLRSVFERMGEALGRKPNSIRNFYYAQIRSGKDSPHAMPFETFAPDEVESLLRNVLTARAQGMSVRACVRRLAGGDRTLMLRLQNKYRSTIRTRPELVRRVMQELSDEGTAFVSPYAAQEDGLSTLKTRAGQSGDPQITQLFSSLDHLMDLAFAPHDEQDNGALRRADRLNARCDMLRIELADEKERFSHLQDEAGSMVTLLKEYIALPDTDRQTHCQAFCQQASARLSAMECAMQAAPLPSSEPTE